MTPVETIRAVHIVAGTLALGSFGVPLISRKGGPLHRRAGWIYCYSMWAAAVAAWAICAARLIDDDASNDVPAVFLAFVGLLAANGAATGVRVLRMKTRAAETPSKVDVGSSALLLAASVGLGVFGIVHGATLSVAFGALGTFLAVRQLRSWLRRPAGKFDWWYAHMGNMLAACIGTVTAFLVVNVPRFGLNRYGLFFWLGPGVLGGVAITVWTRHYRRKFEGHARS